MAEKQNERVGRRSLGKRKKLNKTKEERTQMVGLKQGNATQTKRPHLGRIKVHREQSRMIVGGLYYISIPETSFILENSSCYSTSTQRSQNDQITKKTFDQSSEKSKNEPKTLLILVESDSSGGIPHYDAVIGCSPSGLTSIQSPEMEEE